MCTDTCRTCLHHGDEPAFIWRQGVQLACSYPRSFLCIQVNAWTGQVMCRRLEAALSTHTVYVHIHRFIKISHVILSKAFTGWSSLVVVDFPTCMAMVLAL